ncbi:cell division control protein Cdc6 [Rhodotorula toruloides]|uniref:Cell division control protein Cdc6 n=1 Tax=Rhodotorula toruloides TaxID=5286 RepID=A0A511KR26_RHOTO|nr:cell division control protein Cdc6 [Rhodotorula toruloides]
MLGKRTRQDAPLVSSKRALTAYLPSTKPPVAQGDVKAGASFAMGRTESQKENCALQAGLEDAVMDPEQDQYALDELFALPTPPPSFELPESSSSELSHIPSPAPEPPTSPGVPNIYTHASSLLTPSSSFSSSLPLTGRTDQHETLLAFLTRRFPSIYVSTSNSRPGPAAMYVSGPPGIGKTALLSSIIKAFRELVEERRMEGEVGVLVENCTTIAGQGSVWERLGRGLGMKMYLGGERSTRRAKEAFEDGLRDGRKYLLVLDEIDHLVSSTASTGSSSSYQPDLLSSLFALASTPASPLTLIGIANDLTLKALALTTCTPVGTGKGRAKADPLNTPTKPIRVHFKPYSWQELVAIVAQRLSLLAPQYPLALEDASAATLTTEQPAPGKKATYPLIDNPALERCAKKIAAGTGDVRTMLDVIRRAIALVAADQSSNPTISSLSTFTPATAPKASMKHVSSALAASAGLTAAPTLAARLAALQGGPHQRVALVSVLVAISRIDPSQPGLDRPSTPEGLRVVLDEAYKVYREIVAREDVLRAQALDASAYAETVGMVEDLGGFVVVRGRPGSSPSTSPSSSGGRVKRTPTPTKTKKHERGKMTVELSPTSPLGELVAVLASLPAEADVDETSRLMRRVIEREKAHQRWAVKRRSLGRDEDRRAEEVLEGREWEKKVLAGGRKGEADE